MVISKTFCVCMILLACIAIGDGRAKMEAKSGQGNGNDQEKAADEPIGESATSRQTNSTVEISDATKRCGFLVNILDNLGLWPFGNGYDIDEDDDNNDWWNTEERRLRKSEASRAKAAKSGS